MYVPSTSLRGEPIFYFVSSPLRNSSCHSICYLSIMFTRILLIYMLCFFQSGSVPSPVDYGCCCLQHNILLTVLFFKSVTPPQSMVSAVCLKHNVNGSTQDPPSVGRRIILVPGVMQIYHRYFIYIFFYHNVSRSQ